MPANITEPCDRAIAKLEQFNFAISKMRYSLQRIRKLRVPESLAAGLIETLANFERGLEFAEATQNLETLTATFTSIEETVRDLKKHGL